MGDAGAPEALTAASPAVSQALPRWRRVVITGWWPHSCLSLAAHCQALVGQEVGGRRDTRGCMRTPGPGEAQRRLLSPAPPVVISLGQPLQDPGLLRPAHSLAVQLLQTGTCCGTLAKCVREAPGSAACSSPDGGPLDGGSLDGRWPPQPSTVALGHHTRPGPGCRRETELGTLEAGGRSESGPLSLKPPSRSEPSPQHTPVQGIW